MSDPLVTCVLLTADRPAMTARAVRCFLAQTYERKALLIFDSGKEPFNATLTNYGTGDYIEIAKSKVYTRAEKFAGSSIGALRNAANELCAGTDIIAHWDSDDWSHPYRLAEQVNLLQASQADAVGYHDMLMWATVGFSCDRIDVTMSGLYGGPASTRREFIPGPAHEKKEAHLYRYTPARDATRYALGTSLLYWRRAWERHKFIDTREPGCKERGGEDNRWIREVRCVSESSVEECEQCRESGYGITPDGYAAPRMIAEIHGGNSSPSMVPGILVGDNYTRVPEWDAYCRERMKL